MLRSLQRHLWVLVLCLLVLAPVPLLLVMPPPGADAPLLLSLGAGFVAFAGITAQFLTPSRIGALTAPFTQGSLAAFHRRLGTIVLVLVALHAVVFVAAEPSFAYYLLPVDGPLKAQAGWLAAVSIAILVVSSRWRTELRLRYERWHLLHILLGVVAIAGSAYHILVISWGSAWPPLRWYVVALFVCGAAAATYRRVIRPYNTLNRPYVVTGVLPEHGNAVTIALQAYGHRGRAFMPGQFAWITIGDAPYTLAQHPFSYASSAARPASIAFTIRSLGDFSSSLADLHPGTRILVDGPHGSYQPPLRRAGFVFITAGIGITPAMSFLRTFAGMRNPPPTLLIHGARTYDDLTFRDEIAALGTQPWLRFLWILSRPGPEWRGHRGRIDARLLHAVLANGSHRYNFFVCGPQAMIDDTLDALLDLGVPRRFIHVDRFEAS